MPDTVVAAAYANADAAYRSATEAYALLRRPIAPTRTTPALRLPRPPQRPLWSPTPPQRKRWPPQRGPPHTRLLPSWPTSPRPPPPSWPPRKLPPAYEPLCWPRRGLVSSRLPRLERGRRTRPTGRALVAPGQLGVRFPLAPRRDVAERLPLITWETGAAAFRISTNNARRRHAGGHCSWLTLRGALAVPTAAGWFGCRLPRHPVVSCPVCPQQGGTTHLWQSRRGDADCSADVADVFQPCPPAGPCGFHDGIRCDHPSFLDQPVMCAGGVESFPIGKFHAAFLGHGLGVEDYQDDRATLDPSTEDQILMRPAGSSGGDIRWCGQDWIDKRHCSSADWYMMDHEKHIERMRDAHNPCDILAAASGPPAPRE